MKIYTQCFHYGPKQVIFSFMSELDIKTKVLLEIFAIYIGGF